MRLALSLALGRSLGPPFALLTLRLLAILAPMAPLSALAAFGLMLLCCLVMVLARRLEPWLAQCWSRPGGL